MDALYKDSLPLIDVSRHLEKIEVFDFLGLDDSVIAPFAQDIEEDNDSIELHLVRTKAYKEALTMQIAQEHRSALFRDLLREEQKTFGGSKIFYLNSDATKVLVLSVKGEMINKLNMVITRLNKVNEKIHRYNTAAKRDNLALYEQRAKEKANLSKKEDMIHFITQHVKL